MDSDVIDVHKESELLLTKLAIFKEEHFKLKKLCIKLLKENKTIHGELQIQESKLQAEENNDSTDTIIKQQRTIIEFLKSKGDYAKLKTDCHSLQRKVANLENRIKTDKAFYEQEMKKLTEKNASQMNEIRKICEDDAKEKLEQIQKRYNELNRKNEKLSIALESVEVETGEIIARLDIEHKGEVFMLKTENQLLLEKMRKQEELYTQKIQNLENENKNKAEFIKKLTQDRNKSNVFQPLDEAFNTNELLINTGKSSVGKSTSSTDRRLSPCITDDDIMEEG